MRCPICGCKECCGGELSEEVAKLEEKLKTIKAKAQLTDREIADMAEEFMQGHVFVYKDFARAIEKKIWEET